jgi:hypothetical protein
MVDESVREYYGFQVSCSTDPAARDVVDSFFGPPSELTAGQRVRLVVDVSDENNGEPVDPPHTVEVIKSDPITIDTGSSRAVLDPAGWQARLTLARRDLDNQIVWGRWILERLFLYLVCRSPRHYPLHSGAIRVGGRDLLVSAPTGVGKSTFTYWALHRGADLLGEDIMVRHLDDRPGSFWGYPRVSYLEPELIKRCPELDGATVADVDNGRKRRVIIPESLAPRLRTNARPSELIFLAHGDPDLRPVDIEEAVERSRSDFGTAKDDTTEIERDLRGQLAEMSIWELGLSRDLDASYDALVDHLSARRPAGSRPPR